jgi:DNA-binding CsgD family transcriptional regulator
VEAPSSVPRARADLVRLAHRGLGVREFSLAAARIVGRVVPFDGVCVLTMDPATLLPTGEVVENGLPGSARRRMTEIELAEADFNKFAQLARRRRPAASLSVATGGKLDRSVRHRELKRPHGFGDELRAALVSGSGTWGAMTLLREQGRAPFKAADAEVVASLSRQLVEGMRRAILLGDRTAAAREPDDVGLLLLDGEDGVASANAAARVWLEELGDDGRPPSAIRAVARRARAVAAGAGDGPAHARIRTASGRWLVVRGTMVGDEAAVLIEPARPSELAPLIADAYGLTARERRVTQLVAQGLSTAEIARRLHVAAYTVQDHLKAIFDKTGAGTRGELVARVFFDHYAPALGEPG